MARTSYTIRTAVPADLPQVARLAGLMVRLHHAWDPKRFAILHEPIEPGYEGWLGRELENDKALVLVAVGKSAKKEGEAKVLGYAYARLEGRDWNRLLDACGFLHDLVVAEDARKRGVAGALLEEVVAWMKERGAPRIVLESAAANGLAQGFFKKRGFRETMIEMARELGEAKD
jgi:ribosomal protein S18 acetylase RimI-like enzyme